MAAAEVMSSPVIALPAQCLPSGLCGLSFQGGPSTPSYRSRCPSIAELGGGDSPANSPPVSPRRRSPSVESVAVRCSGTEINELPQRRRVRFDTELSLHSD